MRKVVYLVASSLDGSIAKADHTFDCFRADGEHVADYLESLKSFGDVLMGRHTYDVGLRMGVTNPYPSMKSYVFSQSMKESPDRHVHLVREDAAGFVRNLKQQQGRDIYLCGGGELAATLFRAGLIDKVILKLNPLLIGSGIPLFSRIEAPAALELVDTKTYCESGVVFLSYRVNTQ
jgi:dihydrofolate reductase